MEKEINEDDLKFGPTLNNHFIIRFPEESNTDEWLFESISEFKYNNEIGKYNDVEIIVRDFLDKGLDNEFFIKNKELNFTIDLLNSYGSIRKRLIINSKIKNVILFCNGGLNFSEKKDISRNKLIIEPIYIKIEMIK